MKFLATYSIRGRYGLSRPSPHRVYLWAHDSKHRVEVISPNGAMATPLSHLEANLVPCPFQVDDPFVHALPVQTSCRVPSSTSFVLSFVRHLSVGLVQDLPNYLKASDPSKSSTSKMFTASLAVPLDCDTISNASCCVRFTDLFQHFYCCVLLAPEYSPTRMCTNFLRPLPSLSN